MTTRELFHPALEATDGNLLEHADLTEQQRLGVVLQGAALLSHLEHGGFHLASGWRQARVDKDGLLRAAVRRGHSTELPQVLLRELVRRLFRFQDEIKGRGSARRAARALLARWRQTLAPVAPDRAVAEILEAAPFLWQPAFSQARTALLAEHRSGARSHLWLAGPGAARRRFLAGHRDRRAIERLLRGPRALDLWEGWREDLDPREAAGRGAHHQAIAVWRRCSPESSEDVVAFASSLFALGRYSQALQALKRRTRYSARLLRAWCQLFLGELNAARGTVRQLAAGNLSAERTVEVAEVAVRILAARGEKEEIREWIARARDGAQGDVRLRAEITAAGAAWDLKDFDAMDRFLESSREALERPELAAKWHHARGLRSIDAADGLGAVEHVGAALRLDRRRLTRAQAGRLWNDLAISRVYAGDLPGAERACRHALRLLSVCEGPSPTTLALHNLAEIQLRRGRVAGVEKTLEISIAENRRAGNRRALIRDLELWVRLELTLGKAGAALARCAEAQQELGEEVDERQSVFEVLAARALGWLKRPDEAADRLESAQPEAICELEIEERPAVWALAGRPQEAAKEATSTPWAGLWAALAAGSHPRPEAWNALRALEPFRAARLVFDCESVLAGVVPPQWVRRAILALRRSGAETLADKLESRSLSPWRALETYFERQLTDREAMAELLTTAGYPDVRLIWIRRDDERILIAGEGGPRELTATLGDGELVLQTSTCDSILDALFALIQRDLEPLSRGNSELRAPPPDGIIGSSPSFTQALRRLDRLAGGDLPILVLGESGTGKELFARRAHESSRRRSGPFLAVNCAALSETLIQSDLFGHVRGSFTGANRDHSGIFESATGGTVFLDEIGDLPLAEQGKLLRVLQESEIRRVGESFSRKVDVRMVAATHRDLEQMVDGGSFRQDLFFRLKVATIELPPLRERAEDILLLADHFLARKRTVSEAPRLSPEARARLLSHTWPGNIRELQNLLEVAVVLAEDGEIGSEHLDLPAHQTKAGTGDYHQLVESYRKKLVAEALARSDGNRSRAARRLGLSRQALSYLVRQLGLS